MGKKKYGVGLVVVGFILSVMSGTDAPLMILWSLVALAGFILFFEGLKGEIIDALRNPKAGDAKPSRE